jgi:hypothetical protein
MTFHSDNKTVTAAKKWLFIPMLKLLNPHRNDFWPEFVNEKKWLFIPM